MPFSSLRPGRVPFNRYTLSLWLRSVRGKRLIELESAELRRVLPDVFGRHLLQIGSWGRGDELLESCETLHHAVIGTVADFGEQARSLPEELPVLSKSVDGVVLPHTLEYSQSPHNVLREAARVLNDRGRLFVLGFNPWGGWVMRQRVGFGYRAFPPPAGYYGIGRISDWLELLDFEVTEVRRFSAGFPWIGPRSQHQSWSLGNLLSPFAESYMVVARKRVLPVNFVGKAQRAQIKPIIGAAVQGAAQSTASSQTVNP